MTALAAESLSCPDPQLGPKNDLLKHRFAAAQRSATFASSSTLLAINLGGDKCLKSAL
jgi:hypothetical protein